VCIAGSLKQSEPCVTLVYFPTGLAPGRQGRCKQALFNPFMHFVHTENSLL